MELDAVRAGIPPKSGWTAGIVTEYNPFHQGHAWMVRRLRELGAGAVVCVMSGPFVQRAQPALLPTGVRAKAAVAGGADLVFRLPLPWAAASAEGFAAAGVGLLAALGCVDVLAFGAETADVDALWQAAALLEHPAFGSCLKEQLQGGASFAAARAAAAEQLRPGTGALLASPNNILGIEYCKALQRGHRLAPAVLAGAAMPAPLALPRRGAAHDGPPQDGFASASWLRGQVHAGGIEALEGYVPSGCLPLYRAAARQGMLLDPQRWELAMLSRLRGRSAKDFARAPGAGEGLEARLAAAAQTATSLAALYDSAKTRRFAHSRVRRLALGAALGLPKNPPALPPFLHLLAASGQGLALLKTARQTARLPLGNALAKLARTGGEAARTARLESSAEDILALCWQRPVPGGAAYTCPVQILRRESDPPHEKDGTNQR